METSLVENKLIEKSSPPALQSGGIVKYEVLPAVEFHLYETVKCEEEEEFEHELPMTTTKDPLCPECFDGVEMSPSGHSRLKQEQLQDVGHLNSLSGSGSDDITFICGLCQTSFFEESALISHLSAIHRDRQTLQLLKCTECTETFSDRKLLMLNKTTHSTAETLSEHSKEIICAYSTSRHPKKIQKMHYCQHCNKNFLFRNFKKHSQSHHRYKCPGKNCTKSFTTTVDLTKHLKTHTSDQLPGSVGGIGEPGHFPMPSTKRGRPLKTFRKIKGKKI